MVIPDLSFTDPYPGFVFQSVSRILDPDPGNQKLIFKGKDKILGEIFAFNPKIGILFLFSTDQVGTYLGTYFIKQGTFILYHF